MTASLITVAPEDLIKIAIGTFVGISAYVLDRVAKKNEKKAEREVDEEEILEVVTKKELDELIGQVSLIQENHEKVRNAFEDTLICYTVIQILLEPLKYDERDTLEITCNQVFTFLRHCDDGLSKEMVQTFMEIAIQQRKDKKKNDALDAGTNH